MPIALTEILDVEQMSDPAVAISTKHTEHGYLALPPGGDGPGVLLLHAWWGLNEYFKDLTEQLAQAGYVALAPDLYAGETATTQAQARTLNEALDKAHVEMQLKRAVAYMLTNPVVTSDTLAVIGFSTGARWALWLSDQRPNEIAAVVVFYGTRGGKYAKAKAKYLGHFAQNDVYVSRRSTRTLEKNLDIAGLDATFHVYDGTEHWFMEPYRRNDYDADAAGLAWNRTLAFLEDTVG